jgi:hypothetical protein
MKLLRREEDRLTFELTSREGEALRFVLARYPALDPTYHQIARPESAATLCEEQRLLAEAMAETQTLNRRRVADFLLRHVGPSVESADGHGMLRLSINMAEANWLLEVLNDVRVGAWVKLGRPASGRAFPTKPDRQKLADYGAMEIAGQVQSVVLAALQA